MSDPGPVRRVLAALFFAVAVAGCSAVGIATQPDRPDGGPICEDVKIDGGHRVLTCAEAVAAAEASLGLHWPISSATFDLGYDGTRDPGHLVCSTPGCAGPLIRKGAVRFQFWFGDPVEIFITLDEDDVPVVTEPRDESGRELAPLALG